jgi:hypothetical protein
MSSVMAVALNAEQERSQNALASKHTHAPELPASSSAGIPSGSQRRRKSASSR